MELQIRAGEQVWNLFKEQLDRWQILGDRVDAAANIVYGPLNPDIVQTARSLEVQIQPFPAPLPALQRQNNPAGGRRAQDSSVTVEGGHSWNRGEGDEGLENETFFTMIVAGLIQDALTYQAQELLLLQFPTFHVKQYEAKHGGFHDGLLDQTLMHGCRNLTEMYLDGPDRWRGYFPTLQRQLIDLAKANGRL